MAQAAKAIGLPINGIDDEGVSTAFVAAIAELVGLLGIPSAMSAYGVVSTDLAELTDAALSVKRLMDNNPVPLTYDEVYSIYQSILN
jgi:alcohol dehydrogenase class IV